MSSERTEKATPRRRQKAEQEGDRPRSRELLSAAALLAGSLTLGWAARTWLPVWTGVYQDALALICTPNMCGRCAEHVLTETDCCWRRAVPICDAGCSRRERDGRHGSESRIAPAAGGELLRNGRD